MSAADALLGANINEHGIVNTLSATTKDIILGLGLDVEAAKFTFDRLYSLFPEGSEFDYMNDTFGEARVLMRTESGITLYLPYLDKTDLYSPDFSIYRDPAFSESLRISDDSLRQKVSDTYTKILNGEKGMFLSRFREMQKMQEMPSNISQRSFNLLSAVNSLMCLNPWHYIEGDSVANIITYQYGDFYHFAVGDCFHPATYLLDIYHYLTVGDCCDV